MIYLFYIESCEVLTYEMTFGKSLIPTRIFPVSFSGLKLRSNLRREIYLLWRKSPPTSLVHHLVTIRLFGTILKLFRILLLLLNSYKAYQVEPAAYIPKISFNPVTGRSNSDSRISSHLPEVLDGSIRNMGESRDVDCVKVMADSRNILY